MGIFCNCCLGTFLSFEHISRCAADRLRRGKTLCLRRTGPRPDPRCRHSRCRVSGQTKRTPPPQRETASAGVYMGLGEGLRIPDPRRGAAGQQTGSSPAIATSRISAPAQRLRAVNRPDVGPHGRLEDPEQPGYFRLREPHLAPGRAADRDPLPVDRNRPRENALHRRLYYRSAGRAFISRRMVWSSTLA